MRTEQQRAGDAAEDLVADQLTASGWKIVARRLRLGRDELDLVAVDPGPPASLVVVEVRWRRRRAYGLPEETFDHRKRARLRRACGRLIEHEWTGAARGRGLPVRVDLVAVEPALTGRGFRIRHHRDALGG
jgi:putative endonuclease